MWTQYQAELLLCNHDEWTCFQLSLILSDLFANMHIG
jgi:hypothetical protein